VAAHLGIADLLAEGPQTHETLAAKTGTHPGALRRVVRRSPAPVSSTRILTDPSN
jgi:hypothetical protein